MLRIQILLALMTKKNPRCFLSFFFLVLIMYSIVIIIIFLDYSTTLRFFRCVTNWAVDRKSLYSFIRFYEFTSLPLCYSHFNSLFTTYCATFKESQLFLEVNLLFDKSICDVSASIIIYGFYNRTLKVWSRTINLMNVRSQF